MKRNLVLPGGRVVEEVEPGVWILANPMTGNSRTLEKEERRILVAAWSAAELRFSLEVAQPALHRLSDEWRAEVVKLHERHDKELFHAKLIMLAACSLGALIAPWVRALL